MLLKNFTLLYVEDHTDMQNIMKEILEDEVKEFYQAFDGEQGLALYKEKKPDIIISDISMPNMDGLDMAKEIKAIDKEQDILILSAFQDIVILKRAIDIGVDAFISKPVRDIDELFDKLEKISMHLQNKKDLEVALVKSFQQAQIIQQIHDSVISTDLNGVITSWNSGSTKLLGYSDEETIGEHIGMLYPPEKLELITKYIEILINKGEYSSPVEVVDKNGKVIDAELSLSLLKDDNGLLKGVISYLKDITSRKKAEEELETQKNELDYQAHHDSLTGLPNRVYFHRKLQEGIDKSKLDDNKLALFFIDLDYFKEINDSLGHEVGDEVLKTVTSRLRESLRKDDIAARLGGDEFTVIMQSLEHGEDASLLAEKIIKALSAPMLIDGNKLQISCSIGISLYPDDAQEEKDLLKYADIAMYRAKDEGRSNFQFYNSEMIELVLERIRMESNLRNALKNEDFVVYYQPQVDGRTSKLIGMEALVRCTHKQMGIVSPSSFIPLAESTGMIVELDRFVMKSAMTQLAKWYGEGLNPGVLAMNLSAKQLQEKDFIAVLETMLIETKCKPEWLELEVTESQIIANPQEAVKMLNRISDMGIELAVDDFGTGYSSLAYLKELPINKLKIDQSFVKDLPFDENDIVITKTIIGLAKSLNLRVIAEGVETKEQRDFLIENGCNSIQGHYYSNPKSAEGMRELLNKGKLRDD
jgi:diguanylate cyclase (GGDEF)-like protein/PAS domain S-box-containing protein